MMSLKREARGLKEGRGRWGDEEGGGREREMEKRWFTFG